MTDKKTEEYNRGFEQGVIQGRFAAMAMKEDADGCVGCAFEDVESWQPPCTMCKRNSKDYWRAKRIDD